MPPIEERLKNFIEQFKLIKCLDGNLDNYTIKVTDPEQGIRNLIVIETIEKEWFGSVLRNVNKITSQLDLNYYIDRERFYLVIH